MQKAAVCVILMIQLFTEEEESQACFFLMSDILHYAQNDMKVGYVTCRKKYYVLLLLILPSF